MMASEKLIVALDFDNLDYASRLVEQLSDCVGMFKIGSQLFTAAGPAAIHMLLEHQKRIFLDLKFHDIPNTVARAAAAATELCVDMFNVHVAGGATMMNEAAKAAKLTAEQLGINAPLVLGVTVLTSLDEQQLQSTWNTTLPLCELIASFAKSAKQSGLDGVIASPHEIDVIRQVCGKDFLIVTPGVRPSWAVQDDQQRVMTPGEAIARGADYIVVGRPIYAAPNPKEAAMNIINETKHAD